MAAPTPEVFTDEKGVRRVKGVSVVLPVVTGTIAFWLAKKATEHASHKWTVYLRHASGQDLSYMLSKVTFGLHSSFANPSRDVEYQPYELTEVGWGEFDITIRLHFANDVHEEPVELYHHLTLYDASGANSAKRPVVHETFDEVVLWEPTEALWSRLQNHVPTPAPPSQLAQFHTEFSTDYDYRRLQHARQMVAAITANVKSQLAALDGDAVGTPGA